MMVFDVTYCYSLISDWIRFDLYFDDNEPGGSIEFEIHLE
jgi:hypothetical protein